MTAANDAPRAPLNEDALRAAATGSGLPWRRLSVVAEVGSTNADLLARAAAGENIDGVVLLAEHQIAGRGRSGRTWSATPRGQIIMSVGVGLHDVPREAWGWLPLAAGVATVDAVAATTGIRARLKWPNDVLAGEGKLAGILAEVATPLPVVVLGVGLNVSERPDDIAVPGATSLLALGAAPDRNDLARCLLQELGKRIANWRAAGTRPALTDDYRVRSLTIGSRVRAVLPGGRDIVGVALAVDEQGRLRVDTGHGVTAISAGDIVHLRPAGNGLSG
jgi:BirA family biotin operon repressor/biotin-[acetyl-CoA-carboxylase] ligase